MFVAHTLAARGMRTVVVDTFPEHLTDNPGNVYQSLAWRIRLLSRQAQVHSLVTTGGFDTHLDRIARTDWVIEAIVERLDTKQELLAKVDAHRRPGTIVSSNTSGIPIAALAEGRSDDFRRHWIGTHFFNPPRYLRLLEIIPTPETDAAVVSAVTRIGDHLLGKGVVVAKDTPNFIGNHIGLYGVAAILQALATGKYTIEEIDAVTGPAIGRPGSATREASRPLACASRASVCPVASSPIAPNSATRAPRAAALRATLAAPPGSSASPAMTRTGIGASGDMRSTRPWTKRSSMTSPTQSNRTPEIASSSAAVRSGLGGDPSMVDQDSEKPSSRSRAAQSMWPKVMCIS